MKRPTSDDSPVTKGELKEIFKDYPTKDNMSETINKSFEVFRQENNHNFKMMMDRLDEKFSKFTSLIITTLDPLLKEPETRQQDREIAAAEMRDVKADITNLRKRVTKLEHS